jgi:endonuclease/exonuclease/phosphatase family metal-dependent hydrolase
MTANPAMFDSEETSSHEPQAGNAKSSLRLLSYNIQAAIASTRPHHYLTHSWKHVLPHPSSFDNLDRIARLVTNYDLVAIQEADAGSLRSYFVNQVEYLAQRGHFPFWCHQTNRDLGKFAQHSNGLLSKIRPNFIAHHKLPGLIPGRGAILAELGHSDAPLAVLLVHLALGKRARVKQFDFISELISGYEHAVVMGDFNCVPKSHEMDTLLSKSNLCEPAQDLHTFPSWRPYRNIDHILVSPSLKISNLQVIQHPLSDHLPIAVEIEVPDEVQLLTG